MFDAEYSGAALDMIKMFNGVDVANSSVFLIRKALFERLIYQFDGSSVWKFDRDTASRIVQEMNIEICAEAFDQLGHLDPDSLLNQLLDSVARVILKYGQALNDAGMGPLRKFDGFLKLN
jgi:hypothetical protein